MGSLGGFLKSLTGNTDLSAQDVSGNKEEISGNSNRVGSPIAIGGEDYLKGQGIRERFFVFDTFRCSSIDSVRRKWLIPSPLVSILSSE